jgi:hypothetical protein
VGAGSLLVNVVVLLTPEPGDSSDDRMRC